LCQGECWGKLDLKYFEHALFGLFMGIVIIVADNLIAVKIVMKDK